jgi:hypothetical protein
VCIVFLRNGPGARVDERYVEVFKHERGGGKECKVGMSVDRGSSDPQFIAIFNHSLTKANTSKMSLSTKADCGELRWYLHNGAAGVLLVDCVNGVNGKSDRTYTLRGLVKHLALIAERVGTFHEIIKVLASLENALNGLVLCKSGVRIMISVFPRNAYENDLRFV